MPVLYFKVLERFKDIEAGSEDIEAGTEDIEASIDEMEPDPYRICVMAGYVTNLDTKISYGIPKFQDPVTMRYVPLTPDEIGEIKWRAGYSLEKMYEDIKCILGKGVQIKK